MTNLAKTKQKAGPADIAQVTFLIDRSDSMRPIREEAEAAIERTIQEFAGREGMVFAIRTFNSRVETVADFGADLTNTSVHYVPSGMTALYSSITESIQLSDADAKLTPDIKVHHVMVILTDGDDTLSDPADLVAAKKAIADFGVKATFIMLDFSPDGVAGNPIGLKGIKFSHNAAEFKKAMDQVLTAIGQITDNIIKQLPPDSGLCLPPAR